MINGFAYLDRKFRDPAEFQRLQELAAHDKHGVFAPTHPIRMGVGGELAGYFSVGAVPLVLAHLSTQDLSSRDSFNLINNVENLVALNNYTAVCFPVPRQSPFHPLMEKMGFLNLGEYDLFLKNL